MGPVQSGAVKTSGERSVYSPRTDRKDNHKKVILLRYDLKKKQADLKTDLLLGHLFSIASHFDLDIHTGGKLESHQRVNGLGVAIIDIEKPAV